MTLVSPSDTRFEALRGAATQTRSASKGTRLIRASTSSKAGSIPLRSASVKASSTCVSIAPFTVSLNNHPFLAATNGRMTERVLRGLSETTLRHTFRARASSQVCVAGAADDVAVIERGLQDL